VLAPLPAGGGASNDPDLLQALFNAAAGLCKALAKHITAALPAALKHTKGEQHTRHRLSGCWVLGRRSVQQHLPAKTPIGATDGRDSKEAAPKLGGAALPKVPSKTGLIASVVLLSVLLFVLQSCGTIRSTTCAAWLLRRLASCCVSHPARA
jgi:hypothetical protein